ncbi:hypothetical protein [Tellurirhabdus rosea]|uniref:hypothetical protein n=1 Tax=Tellurirhabdus rosea TaxID=2674997 RepID=UPI0022592B44|nr:hypothetical protein [Tellurirhabdus rosea]
MLILYLLWALLNIFLFIYLLGLYYRAVRLVRQEYGVFAACVLVFGFLSFGGCSSDRQKSNQPPDLVNFVPKDSTEQTDLLRANVDLENGGLFRIRLWVDYGRDKKTQQSVPISGVSSFNGLSAGIWWEPQFIYASRPDAVGHVRYTVHGTLHWRLLGATVFSENKLYKGTALAKEQ